MKKIVILLFILYMLTNILFAQTASYREYSRITQINDSLTSDKDDLDLLVERIYLAFKAYRKGKYEVEEQPKPDSLRIVYLYSLRQKGWLPNFRLMNEKPIYPVIIRNEKYAPGAIDLNNITSDSIQSIEIMDTGYGIAGLHGLSARGIVIRLKE